MFTIAIRPEEADDMNADARRGFEDFARNVAVFTPPTGIDPDGLASWTRGWFNGWSRCFAEGVKASILDGLAGREGESPYSQFSAQWEAWAEGYDSESTLPPPPADVAVIMNDADRLTLADFLEANRDGIGEEEASDIRVTLARGETFTGGGGAADAFSLAPAPALADA